MSSEILHMGHRKTTPSNKLVVEAAEAAVVSASDDGADDDAVRWYTEYATAPLQNQDNETHKKKKKQKKLE